MTSTNITQTCYDLAVNNLIKNSSQYGLLAANPNHNDEKPTYSSLYPRDVGVSIIGMLTSDDDRLIQICKTSLETLAQAQSKRGQFPHCYEPKGKTVEWWHPGTIDGTLWWPIAVLEYVKQTGDTTFYDTYADRIERAFTWLTYQDTNNDALLEQGEAAGWDDEMPRHGTVLYTNALWYLFIKLRIEVENRQDLTDLKDDIYEGVNTFLWMLKGEDKQTNYIPSNGYVERNYFAHRFIEMTNAQAVYLPYYVGYVGHLSFETRCETYGNILACLTGLADEKKRNLIVDFMLRSGVNKPYPIKVMYPPIYPGEESWRAYMAKGRQNYPWQYHNAGIWPYVGGFWVKLLAQMQHELAESELTKLAEANQVENWAFNEYLHGQHGTPMGVEYQSWNMAMYVGAHQAVKRG